MSHKEDFDFIVVGGGVTGCATAWALAQEGSRVLLIERHHVGHGHGSSHGRSRIIRLSYSSVPYIELSRAAYGAWRALEAETSQNLMQIVGGLDLTFKPLESWLSTAEAMTSADVPFERLDRDAVKSRFPQFDLPDGASALFQRDTGVLHADRCIETFKSLALAAGAIVREGEAVLSIIPSGSGVEVVSECARYLAGRLVLAAGPQTKSLAAELGLELPLVVSKETVGFYRPRDPVLFSPAHFPVFILHQGNGRLGSGFPIIRDPGVKLLIERRSASVEGDTTHDPHYLARQAQEMKPLLPDLEGMMDSDACWYTLTPNDHFIVDHHPQFPQIIIASACSGHGFKFAPLLGAALADMCWDRKPAIDMDLFRIAANEGAGGDRPVRRADA